jgi:hypothetical protein
MFWLSFLIHIPLLLFLSFFFAGKWRSLPLRNYYFSALSVKIIAGILLGLVYLLIYNGEGDTFSLFEGAVRLNNFLYTSPVEYFRYLFLNHASLDTSFNDLLLKPRVLIFVKVLSIINIFTFSNYWVTGMYLSFFSFLGLYLLANSIVRIFKISFLPALIAFLFFPSVVFWSSGIIKESMLMGALGFVVSYFLLWVYQLEKPDAKRILFCLICLLLILILKFYYFAALVPTMVSCFFALRLCRLPGLKNLTWFHPFILVSIFASITLIVSLLHPILHPSVFIEYLLRNYGDTLTLSNGKNVFYFPELNSDWPSLFFQFPKAVFIGLFRPLPGDVSSAKAYVSIFENILILIFFIITVANLIIKRPVVSNIILFTAVGIYIIMLSFLLPIASPNWGSLVRYKVGYLPFLLLLITFRNPLIFYMKSRFLKQKEIDGSALVQNSSSQ